MRRDADPESVAPGFDRATAAIVAAEALAEVFDAEAVAVLREDSPLAVLGLAPDDVVCIADAIARAALRRGLVREMSDADFVGLATVADLIDAINRVDGTAKEGTA